jgi:outer membrane protein
MNLKKIVSVLVLSLPCTAMADVLYGVYIEAGGRQATTVTDLSYGSDTNYFSMDSVDHSNQFISVRIEHLVPVIPNFRVAREEYSLSSRVASQGFTFNDKTYANEFSSNVSMVESTATVYYEILDNWISLDVGFSVKNIHLGADFSDDGGGAGESIDLYVPAVYLNAEFAVPVTGLIVGVTVEGLQIQDQEYSVLDAYVGYEFLNLTLVDFTFKIGVQKKTFTIDDVSSFDLNLDQESVYASLQVHF